MNKIVIELTEDQYRALKETLGEQIERLENTGDNEDRAVIAYLNRLYTKLAKVKS